MIENDGDDGRLLLAETTPAPPAAASNVDVRVQRTIHANKWSTICLPFAMSAAQVTAAFGSDVELADFTDWTTETDGGGDIVSILVEFTEVNNIQANHPYIIRTTADIAEFTVDGVSVKASDDPVVTVTGEDGDIVPESRTWSGEDF